MIFFRFPDGKDFYTVGRGTEMPVSFVSFDEEQKLEFPGIMKVISETDIPELDSSVLNETSEIISEEKNSYLARTENAVAFIKENRLQKLVLARRKIINSEGKILDLRQTFLNISHAYPNAFSYLMRNGNTCMIGAFSELLGKFDRKKSEFYTMSLAGTLPADEAWTEKEINEQKPVTEYITNILAKFSENVEVSDTYDHFSRQIKHLRNDFKIKLAEARVAELIQQLHPTPAVCGIPKDFCRAAIKNFENFPRNFYSGYIRVETEDHIHYFVNLRCAEFYQNASILYAGGGITAQSQPKKEWRETELKADAVLKNLAYA